MATKYHINPKMRAYGKARIEITRTAKNEKDWQENWREQLHSFPFTRGEGWNFCIEYKVDDFAAEVGFYIDFLGFPSSAFSPNYAQFTTPNGDFFFSVSEAQDGEESTPPDTLRIQFNVADIMDVVAELESRGIEFEQHPQPIQEGTEVLVGCFRTPHGVCIDLWGTREPEISMLDDEDLDEDEIENIISNILHQAEEEDDVFENEDTKIRVDDVKNKSSMDYGQKADSAQINNQNVERTRFPNSIERLDVTSPRTQDSVIGENSQNNEYSGKISSYSSSKQNKPEDVELTYQELDE